MPEYNSIRSYKRQIFNNYQFLLNSAIRLIFNSQITLSLGTVQHPAVSKEQLTGCVFVAGRQRCSGFHWKSPRGRDILTVQQIVIPSGCGTLLEPEQDQHFPFQQGNAPCPVNCSIHHPQEKPEVKSFTCVLQSTLQLGIILHASSHLFAELEHNLGINRSL